MLHSIVKGRKSIVACTGEIIEVTYCLISEGKRIEGIRVVTYGVLVSSESGEKREWAIVKDISPELSEVSDLLDKMHRYEVTPQTVRDIVNDYIES